ncbi:MAG TPA: hypothetical protein VNG69_17840 [Casimicrobiaceae bacterium]|nr:hypothetical protein [Casimicrobiaceae bacterium]
MRLDRAFAWYSEAMRLFKQHPLGFAGMALVVFVGELVLDLIPTVGAAAARIAIPLLACSLLYAALACDRGDAPRLAHLLAPFGAPLPAIGAVVRASLVVSCVEWLVAWQIAGINLFAIDDVRDLKPAAVLAIYGSGVAISLPLTLVPMLALFEGASAREAIATSAAAFFKNAPAFLLFGALSIALLGLAFVTLGLALLIVMPLWAASSYAAWKDLFAIA